MENMGFEVHLELPYEVAVERVVAALKTEGFGVLTRIDVQATFKEKLGEDFRPYVILGACNPPLAHKALSTEPLMGLMLPCNVTVEEDPAGGSLARLVNPELMLQTGSLRENEALCQVAEEAKVRLERVACALAGEVECG
jgi:uncharacterized protein (DUF302 family)